MRAIQGQAIYELKTVQILTDLGLSRSKIAEKLGWFTHGGATPSVMKVQYYQWILAFPQELQDHWKKDQMKLFRDERIFNLRIILNLHQANRRDVEDGSPSWEGIRFRELWGKLSK